MGNLEESFDGAGLHLLLALWCVVTFASYTTVVVVACLLIIVFFVLVGMNFFHKQDKTKRTMGVAASAVLLTVLALIPIIQANYYA